MMPSPMRPASAAALVGVCVLAFAAAIGAAESKSSVLDDIKKYEACVYKSVFSFTNPQYFPPSTLEELKTICKTQSEGFKCLKEQTRGSAPIIRRGLVTLAASRARQHKQVCTNTQSDYSKKFVAGGKCLMEKNRDKFKKLDADLGNHLMSVLHRNYNESAPELKHICCAMVNFKKSFQQMAGSSCPEHHEITEEIIASVVPNDLNLICEDDEKLERSCAKLEKLPPPPPGNSKMSSIASLALYLVATLGEPDATLPHASD